MQAVPHGARGSVPLGQHQAITGLQLVEGLGEFGSSGEALAGCLVLEDELAPVRSQRLTLAIEILRLGAHSGVADQSFRALCCMTHKRYT